MIDQLKPTFLLCSIVVFTNCKMEWKISELPVVFGRDVQLICYTSGENKQSMNITRSRTWFRGPEQELISIDGVSFRKSKYLTATYKEYFSMTIRHFSKEDMKCEYTCYYGTDNYAKINLINESYESFPTSKTKDINYKLSYSQLNVFVCLENVHPIPTCSVWFKQKYLSAIPPTRVKKDDLFYKAEFNITYEVESSGCELLTVICTVGSKRDVLIDETICHDQVKTNQNITQKSTIIMMVVFTGCILVVLLGIVVFVYYCFRPVCANSEETENKDETFKDDHLVNADALKHTTVLTES